MNNNKNIFEQNNGGFLTKIVEHAPIGILTFSRDFVIDFINDNFLKFGVLYKYNLSSVIGLNILNEELFPGINLKSDLLNLEEGLSFEKEIQSIKTPDNKRISVIIKASPLFDNDNFNGGILLIEDTRLFYDINKDIPVDAEQLEFVLNKVAELFLITDLNGEIKYSAGRKLRSLNFPAPSLTGYNINHVFNYSNKIELNRGIFLAKENRITAKLNLELNLKNSREILECKISPLVTKNDNINLLFFWINEISETAKENKRLVNELNELKHYQVITEYTADAVVSINNEGDILFWNKGAEELFGFSKSEVYGKFLGRIIDQVTTEFIGTIRKSLIDKISVTEKLILTDPGKTIKACFNLNEEDPDEIIILFSDLTEEKQLLHSEKLLKNIISNSSEMICTLTPDGFITFVNNKFASALGYSPEEILNRNINSFIDNNFIAGHYLNLEFTNGTHSRSIEIPFTTSLGNTFTFSSEIIPVKSKNHNLEYLICYLRDISGQKKAEKNLELLRSSFKSLPDGIAVLKDNRIVTANNSFADIFGYKYGEELINKNFSDFISLTDKNKAEKYLNEDSSAHPKRFDILGIKNNGTNFYAEISVSPFSISHEFYNVIITRDITEKKKAQISLIESEEKYRNITENIDDFLYTFERINNKLAPVFYTSSVEKITGYNKTEFLDDTRLFLKIIYPDDINIFKEKIKNIINSRFQSSEEFEFRLINKQGNIVWVRNKINIIRNSAGKVQKIYGLISDISLRKKAEEELNKSTENLLKLNETKDRFISIVSHDLRTPFSSILGFTDLLLNDDELTDTERKQYVSFIRESSNSMLSLVNSLLDWTRIQTGRIRFEPEKININSVINKSINSLSGVAYKKKISLHSNIDENIAVFIDEDLILQVFNNLFSNAIKFTKEGGSITVSAKHSSNLRFYEFSVKDTGVGIQKENLNKIFRIDSKFSSEGTMGEKGSGLGLNLVKEIIEKHGGNIRIESEYGSGTEIIFTLPVASADILLVDDSKTDRLLYAKILKNITPDYNIEVVSNGKEALDKVLNSPPALIITDHLMPVMNGYEFVQELIKADIKSKPPIIVLSSDIDRNAIHDYNALGIEYVFQKPVNLTNFKIAVERSLKKGMF